MLKENRTLSLLRLSGNPIGRRGGRAVFRAIRRCLLHGWEREVVRRLLDVSGMRRSAGHSRVLTRVSLLAIRESLEDAFRSETVDRF